MIICRDLRKRYPKELGGSNSVALKGVSFSLPSGKTLGLIGANGAGKSTCIHLLMGFIRPDMGTIEIAGIQPDHAMLRKNVGYLPEVATFPANLNVLDMLKFSGSACGLSDKEIILRAEILLVELELWEFRKRPLRSYSKGMQQRASFAVALIADPELLILDEPMSGLDPVGREKVISLIHRLKREGKTILFCSHILEDVDRLADHLLVLHHGEKLFDGTVNQFCAQEQAVTITEAFLSIINTNNDTDGSKADTYV